MHGRADFAPRRTTKSQTFLRVSQDCTFLKGKQSEDTRAFLYKHTKFAPFLLHNGTKQRNKLDDIELSPCP